jgi:hypothetical protein
MASLRTPETEALYTKYRQDGHLENGCRLCDQPFTTEFEHWKIMPNRFPYDQIASQHDMIVPKRHVDEKGITEEEWQEYECIKEANLHTSYNFFIEAAHSQKSIPGHFHIHLVVLK